MYESQRPYKSYPPTDTITQIRNLLFSTGIFTSEEAWGNPYDNMYSVSVGTTRELGAFTTHGKSTTPEYCLASAYGEFIERLQNNTQLLNIPSSIYSMLKDKYGFYSYPDEVFLNKKTFLELSRDILEDIFGTTDGTTYEKYYEMAEKKNGKGCLAVPFFDYSTKEITHIPYNLLLSSVGSNGMAAGNTRDEAITQALFELMERWAAARVFYEKLTPPDVPESYLKEFKEEWALISDLRRDGLTVKIKDFSCNMIFPAVGALIIDPKRKMYHLDVGCESSFKTALTRALTELYQGVQKSGHISRRMLTIPCEMPWYFTENTTEAKIACDKEYQQFTVNGMGYFPPSLFSQKESYKFSPCCFAPQDSYKKEVTYWLQRITEMGHNVFIRDVSFLGFPSCHIYIPNISSLSLRSAPKNYQFEVVDDLESSIDCCYHLKVKNRSDYELLAKFLEKLPRTIPLLSLFNLELESDYKARHIPIGVFLTLVYIILEKHELASHTIEQFLKEAQDVVWILPAKQIQKLLSPQSYLLENVGEDSVDTLLQAVESYLTLDFSAKHLIVDALSLPSCPNCACCKINDKCLTKGRLKLSALTYNEFIKNALRVTQLDFNDL